MSNAVNNLYEFGSYRLDPETSTLWRGREVVLLSPKALEVLKLLIERRGEIVTKREIFEIVWADTFVEDGVLTQNIYTLRNTLGPDENGKQFIETIARKGYRFAGQLKMVGVKEELAALSGRQVRTAFTGFVDSNVTTTLLKDGSKPHLLFGGKIDSESVAKPEGAVTRIPGSDIHSRPLIRRALLSILGLLILSAVGFSIYYFFLRTSDRNESKIAPIEQLRFQRLTDSGDVVFPAISPNGEMLAFVRLEDEKGSVWVKQIATDSSVQILPSSDKGYRSLTFSPDGKYLFFRQEADGSAIYQTTILGGTPKKVGDNAWSDFSVSPDGKQLVFIRRDTGRSLYLLILSNIDGSGEYELSAKNAPDDYRSTPAFSPDGEKIAVATGKQAQLFPKLITIDVSTRTENEVKIPRWRAVQRILWMPKGNHLLITAREAKEPYSQLWMLSYPDGEIRRLTNDLEAYFWISLSADGQMVVTRQQKIFSHLWLLPDGDIKKAKQLTFGVSNLDGYAGLAWTPDDKIIYSVFANNITDLYSISADGGDRVQLTSNAGQDNNFPSVSRDERFIVFTSNRTGTTQIWRMDIDGRNPKQLTFGENPNERVQSPALSVDGTEVFFIKRGAKPSAIWKVSVEGGEAVQVSRLTNATPEGFMSISTDGQHLAYHHIADKPETGRENQVFRIGILPVDGIADPQLFDLPMRRPFVQWTSETAFDYSAGTFNSSSLWRRSMSGREPQKLIDFPDRVFNFAWSPSGKNLVVSRGKQQGDALLITNFPQ